MSSLAHREDLAGRVQMIYIDPPYGIKFASNFQPTTERRSAGEREENLTREPEMVKAYRDTWHLGIHSYLSYLRDRLIMARELLTDSGSVFVQISDENVHKVRSILDEVFGAKNFICQIAFVKTAGLESAHLPSVTDYLLWYARDREQVKYRQLYASKEVSGEAASQYTWLEETNGQERPLTAEELASPNDLPEGSEVFSHQSAYTAGSANTTNFDFEWAGRNFELPSGQRWRTTQNGMLRLGNADRFMILGKSLRYKRRLNDFPVYPLTQLWRDTSVSGFSEPRRYVVQTNPKVIERCVLMTSDPGDLVLDPTCGGGTTAQVAEQWGRRWITIDTSRISIAIARQRILTSRFERYRIEGEDANGNGNENYKPEIDPHPGFVYKSVPHVTLRAIAQNENLDIIFERHNATLEQKLSACNKALKQVDKNLRHKLEKKYLDKQKNEGKRAVTDADRRRWLMPPNNRDRSKQAKDNATVDLEYAGWYHWEVPFDTDEDWPEELKQAVQDYRQAWRAKMDEVNQCIADNAEQVELVDQPEVIKGVTRVSGPFTVEAVQPPEMSLDDEPGIRSDEPGFAGSPEEMDTFHADGEPARQSYEVQPRPDMDVQNVEAYLDQMVRLMRTDGVTFPNNKQMSFTRLERLETSEPGLHAEGRWVAKDSGGGEDDDPEGRAFVAVAIGPQYGPVTAKMVEDCIRGANRMGYDELVIAGFSFDGAAQAAIDEASHPKLRIHQTTIRPDVNPGMDGLLKEQPGSQLFTVFGQPRTELHGPNDDGEYWVTMEGVDIYNPVENSIQSTGADKVAAWFLDSDYDGRTFCITQAFFPDRQA
jgi:adenine-specific DNA-methyltransferase